MKIQLRKIRPTVKPAPCPKLFERSFITMMKMTMFTIGIEEQDDPPHGPSDDLQQDDVL